MVMPRRGPGHRGQDEESGGGGGPYAGTPGRGVDAASPNGAPASRTHAASAAASSGAGALTGEATISSTRSCARPKASRAPYGCRDWYRL